MKTQRVAIGLTMLNLVILMFVLFRATPLRLQKSRQCFAAVPWRSWMTTGAFVR